MSEGQQEAGGGGLIDRIRELVGAKPEAGKVISGVDVTRVLTFVFEDTVASSMSESDAETARRVLEEIVELSRRYIDVFAKDGLSRVVHPVYGYPIIAARLGEIAALLRESIRESWTAARQALRAGDLEAARRHMVRAYTLSRLAPLVLEEVYAKLLTVYHINGPPKARPPLVNAALGYEITG